MFVEQESQKRAIDWDRFPGPAKKQIRNCVFDDKGNLIAPDELIESIAYVSGMLPGLRKLPPSRISQGLFEQASMRTSQGNEELAHQLESLARRVVLQR